MTPSLSLSLSLPRELISNLCTDPVPAAEAARHEAVRAGLGIVLLHVAERNKLPATVSAQSVRAGALELLVIVDVLRLHMRTTRVPSVLG